MPQGFLLFSRLFHGDLVATGAGNVDLSLPLWHAQNGAAMLAFEITVGLAVTPLVFLQAEMILHGLYQLQKALVLASALIDLFGIATEGAPYHKPQRHKPQGPQEGEEGEHQQDQ